MSEAKETFGLENAIQWLGSQRRRFQSFRNVIRMLRRQYQCSACRWMVDCDEFRRECHYRSGKLKWNNRRGEGIDRYARLGWVKGKQQKLLTKYFYILHRNEFTLASTSALKTLRPYRHWQNRPTNLPRFTIERFSFFFELSWAKVHRLNGKKHRTGLIKFRLMPPTLLDLHNRVHWEFSVKRPADCLSSGNWIFFVRWLIDREKR